MADPREVRRTENDPVRAPRSVTEDAIWRLLDDPAWGDLGAESRRAVQGALAGELADMAAAMADAAAEDRSLRALWKRHQRGAREATRGVDIGVGSAPSPGPSWWWCATPGCDTPDEVGTSTGPYLGERCPEHGALSGPHVEPRRRP